MKTAEEMREITLQSCKVSKDEEEKILSYISKQIEDNANMGNYTVEISLKDYKLHKAYETYLINKLKKDFGYIITTIVRCPYLPYEYEESLLISWE